MIEVEAARDSFERGDWDAAFEAWSNADRAALSPDDLDDFATAAELIGCHDDCVDALQRSFIRAQREDDLWRSVRSAFRLAMTTAAHAERAMSAGWVARAEGLVENLAADSRERGWVAFLQMFRALGTGAYDDASALAAQATAAGRLHGDADLTAMGTCSQGRLALYSGRVAEGLALLDEAMVRVIAGEASPIIAGHVYCTAIEGCQEISDFDRVAEWTSALERWCSAQPGLLLFTGQCALHRGQLLRLRGDWPGALSELQRASHRYLQNGTPDAVGLTACEAGDVLRLRGEYDAAEASYQVAADHGFEPQPGLALLWLVRDQDAAALSAVSRLLAEPGGPIERCRLLPGALEVLVHAGELARAQEAAAELSSLAAVFGSTALEAAAAHALGWVELVGGDAAGALPYLRKAQQLWARVESPYDRARAQLLTGEAMLGLGEEPAGRREIETARTTFRRVGAVPDADRASSLLAPSQSLPAGLTAREVEVLRLVATGRSNTEIASELVISEKTIARHLSNIFTKLDVGSRTAAAAFAFEHHLVG